MKKIFLLLGFILVLNTISAQHFTLEFLEDGTDRTDSEMIIEKNPAVGDAVVLDFNVVNNTTSDKKFGLKKTVIYADENITSEFCVMSCYPPTVMELPENDRPTLAPGEEMFLSLHLNGYIYDEEWNVIIVEGRMEVLFELYSGDYPTGLSTILLKFFNGVPVGIEYFDQKFETNIYPNPVRDIANINYQLPEGTQDAFLTIFSYTGNKLREVILPRNEDKVSINVADLPAGIYMYSINCGGRIIATNKLVIQ